MTGLLPDICRPPLLPDAHQEGAVNFPVSFLDEQRPCERDATAQAVVAERLPLELPREVASIGLELVLLVVQPPQEGATLFVRF